MYKTMAKAFINAAMRNEAPQDMFDIVAKTAHNRACKFVEGWSANLSYKTRMALRNQGMPV